MRNSIVSITINDNSKNNMQNWLLHLFDTADLNEAVSSLSLWTVALASAVLALMLLFSVLMRDRYPAAKPWLFGTILVVSVFTTFVLIASTIYLNTVSSSKGPVHWHADFEIWACGEKVELKDPDGFLSNKIGNPVLHEHNDERIHLEGVVIEPRDASLGKFMDVVGGSITSNSLVVPTNDGKRSYVNGQNCDGQPAEVQVFAYQATPDDYYRLEKLDNPADYIIRDESVVPPGDCIIIEFGPPSDATDKMCVQYEVALDLGKLKGPSPW